jgi:hypothetical protein
VIKEPKVMPPKNNDLYPDPSGGGGNPVNAPEFLKVTTLTGSGLRARMAKVCPRKNEVYRINKFFRENFQL